MNIEKDGYLPCYIDVKTVYESSKAQTGNCEHLKIFLPTVNYQSILWREILFKRPKNHLYRNR